MITILEIFCENVEVNPGTKTNEVIFQVNMNDDELIKKFNLSDTREPVVNIYVGVDSDMKTIKYIKCDYHTCEGEHWYGLEYVFSKEECALLKKEVIQSIR